MSSQNNTTEKINNNLFNNRYQDGNKPIMKNSTENNDYDKKKYNQNISSFLTEVPTPQQNNEEINKEQLGDGSHIINNIIGTHDKQDDKSKNTSNKTIGSNEIDLIRDLYSNINSIDVISQQSAQNEKDFITECNTVVLDKTYDDNIKKCKDEKGKFAPIKQFKGWSNMLAIPLMRIIENTDENGEIAVSDYDSFINGPLKELKDDLKKSLEKKDDKGKPSTPIEMQTFIKKALEGIEDIENNNGFSFDPTKMRYNFGIMHKDMSNIYHNISVIDQIIMAIYNFFTFSDFYQDVTEIRIILDRLYEDIKLYYDAPLENRQFLVNRIYERIAKIEYLFSNTYLIKKEDYEALHAIKSDLQEAMKTKINANGIVVAFIRTFGQNAVKSINLDTLDKKTCQAITKALAKSIDNSSDVGEEQSIIIAQQLLEGKKIEKIPLPKSKEKYINVFFDGKTAKEFKFMMDKLNNVGKLEDAKIKANTNLKKVNAISQTTKAIIDAISNYTTKCNQEIEMLRRKFSLLNGAGGNVQEYNVNRSIMDIKLRMFQNIQRIVQNAKKNIYEYIDDNAKREAVIQKADSEFKAEKESIEAIMKEQLYDDNRENPAAGKEDQVIEMKNMLSDMKSIPAFAFANYETIRDILLNIGTQLRTSNEFTSTNYPNNNLFALSTNRANNENALLHQIMDKGFLNTQKQMPRGGGMW